MDGMRQTYNWNSETSISVYHYTSGCRGPGGGGKIHNFIIFGGASGSAGKAGGNMDGAGRSCKGCGANV
ncbi:UNVERIFIED_CONTAM: hypothetical protein Slati_1168400 [Sesamum latifolium]|uniref:Uncharacterized protein n=1 Tax=Sesamum latifolium TaxID=2727402 RepID=A0AAW2XD50_9LAMI